MSEELKLDQKTIEDAASALTEAQRDVVLRMPFAEPGKGWSSTNWPDAEHSAGQQLCSIGVFKDAGCWNWFWTPLGIAIRKHLIGQSTPSSEQGE